MDTTTLAFLLDFGVTAAVSLMTLKAVCTSKDRIKFIRMVVLAIVGSHGGGSFLRDPVILHRLPSIFADPPFTLYASVLAAVVAMGITWAKAWKQLDRPGAVVLSLIADALAVATYLFSGYCLAEAAMLSTLEAILAATLSACGGGILVSLLTTKSVKKTFNMKKRYVCRVAFHAVVMAIFGGETACVLPIALSFWAFSYISIIWDQEEHNVEIRKRKIPRKANARLRAGTQLSARQRLKEISFRQIEFPSHSLIPLARADVGIGPRKARVRVLSGAEAVVADGDEDGAGEDPLAGGFRWIIVVDCPAGGVPAV